jgi:hypothetical protein
MGIYEFLIRDRPIIYRGNLAVWQCHFPGHQDGNNPEDWSCVGYPDGRCYCFGCHSWAGPADLYVQDRFGIFIRPGTKITDDHTRGAYRAAFQALQANNYDVGTKLTVPESRGRELTRIERSFLYQVSELMHQSLINDDEVLEYLERRGTEPYPIFGLARSWQMPIIQDIAKELGDEDLPRRCGIAGWEKPKYMHFLLRDAVVVFQRHKEEVVYYQARTLRKELRTRYYNPKAIAKVPLMYNIHPGGPWLAAEGFFKVAWAIRYGWNVWAPLGTAVKSVPTPYLACLDGGVYLGDRNTNGAGQKAVEDILERATLSGYNLAALPVPRGYTEPDLWAKQIGYANADAELRSFLIRYFG